MNCWKTINFTKQYGSQRLFIMSSLTMLFTFIFLYLPVTYFYVPTSLYDNYFLAFLAGTMLMYPAHKLLHFLPIAHMGKKVKKLIHLKFGFFPIIEIQVSEPIKKSLFLLVLFTPFITINIILIGASYLFPHHVHYIAILIAFHVGLCVPDFIYARNIIFAPKGCYVEENDEGIEILISRTEHK